MKKNMYSVKSNPFRHTDGSDYIYELIVSRGTTSIVANHINITEEMEVRAYCLQLKVHLIRRGKIIEETLDINIGALTQRQNSMRAFINKVVYMDTAPPITELLSMIGKVMDKQEACFEKEANHLLKRKLGVYSFDPFKRKKLERDGLVEKAVEEEDWL